jgi:hypothetical protein
LRVAAARHRALVAAILVAASVILLVPASAAGVENRGLGRFMTAVGRVESGGRYDARNPVTGAYGKYQILPSNWRPWARQYLGNANAPKTPSNQDRVAAGKMGDLYGWLGSWRQVAYWWLTGDDGRGARWSGGPMTYVNKVMAYYYAKAGPIADRRVFNDSSKSIDWSGSWDLASHGGYVAGRVHFATRAGATSTFTFTGRSVAWYGPTGPTRGKARLTIDGRSAGTVDLYASHFDSRQLIFSRRLAKGRHTITITVLGTSGRPYVAVDAFVVRG